MNIQKISQELSQFQHTGTKLHEVIGKVNEIIDALSADEPKETNTVLGMAGQDLEYGDFVYFRDGKFYKAEFGKFPEKPNKDG